MKKIESSFRDPSGNVFSFKGLIYRSINYCYQSEFDHFIESGLKDTLVKKKMMIDFEVIRSGFKNVIKNKNYYKVLQPEQIEFITYPYEWSFSQLKDAALLTLEIQKLSLEYGMTLKDASSYNIQYINNKPYFIDHLSFEKHGNNFIWQAYKQFCQHFLSPLLLMSKVDINLYKLLITFIDGIPLDLTSKLMPKTTYLSYGILSHIHLHAKSLKLNSDARKKTNKTFKLSKLGHLGILDSLSKLINKLNINSENTEWANYYDDTNYKSDSANDKSILLKRIINKYKIKDIVDLGGNNGNFSRKLLRSGVKSYCIDIDPIAVDKNYLINKSKKIKDITPLIYDVANSTQSIGFLNTERPNLFERIPKVDCVMALALIHHLAINNNLSFIQIYELLSKFTTKYMIIEFVNKSDSQVQRLLTSRKDIFEDYNEDMFVKTFKSKCEFLARYPIEKSERILYVFKKRS